MSSQSLLATVFMTGTLLFGAGHAFAAEMTSVDIVEPRAESKWGYAPGTLTVEPGTWITWSNAGQDPHTVTALDNTFDSGPLNPSEGFSWFFPDPGTFEYVCTLHTWMTGTVVVGDGIDVSTPVTEAEPAPSQDDPAPPTD